MLLLLCVWDVKWLALGQCHIDVVSGVLEGRCGEWERGWRRVHGYLAETLRHPVPNRVAVFIGGRAILYTAGSLEWRREGR